MVDLSGFTRSFGWAPVHQPICYSQLQLAVRRRFQQDRHMKSRKQHLCGPVDAQKCSGFWSIPNSSIPDEGFRVVFQLAVNFICRAVHH
ncbi:hypothetical protein M514_06266 [Trichuris suis]|uniref:Uncharacterized protein n=1 Tax=Trichuris suis TaxID=68888 RepID=A0A085NR38_9BILA|nr:hypothetical protein M513_06266 [Trichuris suis]KFD71934.1 hypothetical protein M514_06266 [Trichuris suis]